MNYQPFVRFDEAMWAPQAIVDSTGAGDAFTAAVMYGIATGMAADRIMRLGAVTAGCKLTVLGARPGMPRREQIDRALLS